MNSLNEISTPEKNSELIKLSTEPGNNICADCGFPDPEWVSLNLGIFICIQCSGYFLISKKQKFSL